METHSSFVTSFGRKSQAGGISVGASGLFTLAWLAGCGGDGPKVMNPPRDAIAPSAVNDLAAATLSESMIRLTWTAPGDDSSMGTAASYDVRFSTSRIEEADFSQAARIPNVAAPKEAGQPESLEVGGLNIDAEYFFALKTADEAANVSALSRVASSRTEGPPPTNDNWIGSFSSHPLNGPAHAIAVFQDKLIVGGDFTTAGAASALFIAQWNGTSWSSLAGGVEGRVRALALYSGQLVAGGEFGGTASTTGNIMTWDGNSWQTLGAGLNEVVHALAVYRGMLVAGGAFSGEVDGAGAPNVAAWNGSSWSGFASGPGGLVEALAERGDDLVAGGSFGVSLWDGASWISLGVEGPTLALAVFDGDLIAGGSFQVAGGLDASFIARWDGSAWSPIGGGMNNPVAALGVYKGRLIAGGAFTMAGGFPANRVARWTGSLWRALASGTGGLVNEIGVLDGSMYVAGSFSSAGGKPSRNIAQFQD